MREHRVEGSDMALPGHVCCHGLDQKSLTHLCLYPLECLFSSQWCFRKSLKVGHVVPQQQFQEILP